MDEVPRGESSPLPTQPLYSIRIRPHLKEDAAPPVPARSMKKLELNKNKKSMTWQRFENKERSARGSPLTNSRLVAPQATAKAAAMQWGVEELCAKPTIKPYSFSLITTYWYPVIDILRLLFTSLEIYNARLRQVQLTLCLFLKYIGCARILCIMQRGSKYMGDA